MLLTLLTPLLGKKRVTVVDEYLIVKSTSAPKYSIKRNHMKAIPLDNDFEYEFPILRRDPATGEWEPATGLTGLSARLSTTDGGSAIDASLSVDATERGSLGVYYGTFQGDYLRTHAASYAGQVMFLVFGDEVNIKTSDPVRIQAIRRI